MKTLVTLTFILTTFFSMSQDLEWQHTYGGSGSEVLNNIVRTSDGGYICAGQSRSGISGDKTEASRGNWDYWILKLDSLGAIQWQKTLGGSNIDFLYKVKQTSDGGYICVGQSNSPTSGDKTEASRGAEDFWIVKLDSTGILTWEKTIGGSGSDYCYDVLELQNGDFLCGGSTTSPPSGDKTSLTLGSSDFWLVYLTSAGSLIGEQTLGGFSGERLNCITGTSDGGYLLGGISASNISGTKTENSKGGDDYWLIKCNSSGNEQWQKTIGGSAYDYLYRVKETTDHGFICAGTSLSPVSGDKTETSANWDNWIVRTDSSGTIIWEKTLGGSETDWTQSIDVIPGGGFFCGGWSETNLSGDKTEVNFGGRDNWIYKLDDNGSIVWQNTIGGDTTEEALSVLALGDNDYIVGSHSLSGISGDKNESSRGSTDYWIMKVTEDYNYIKGNIYIDQNSNGTKDPGELNFPAKRVIEPNGKFTYSNRNGDYILQVLNTGTFTVSPDPVSYYAPLPLTHSAFFPALQLTDSLNDFGYQSTVSGINDLSVTIAPATRFRSGQNSTYAISYYNNGTMIMTPEIIFHPDPQLAYVSSSVTPATVSTDSITWSLPLLEPLSGGTILVTLLPNIALPTGWDILSSVYINPVTGDATPSDNYHSWLLDVTNPWDPNDITVNEDTLYPAQVAANTWLDYVIRFQNTGNDTAFNITILNPVDTSKVDISTLQMISASHTADMNWISYERNISFNFNNIQLPDSNVNEEGSHGYVHYRIKARNTLSVGDSITMFGGIYFDFNAPVITNTAVTYIVIPSDIQNHEQEVNYIYIYPNPSNAEVEFKNVVLKNTALVMMFDAMGRIIYSGDIFPGKIKLNVSTFVPGLYTVVISGSDGIWRGKLMVQD
ncbi:MAG: T9SS type A sorting domain-containing protein [Bacteroidota bacterium]